MPLYLNTNLNFIIIQFKEQMFWNIFGMEQAQVAYQCKNIRNIPNHTSKNYQQIKNLAGQFFTKCHNSIDRYLSLSQLGFGINLPFYKTLLIQNQINHQSQLEQLKKNNVRISYFNNQRTLLNNFDAKLQFLLKEMNRISYQLMVLETNIRQELLREFFIGQIIPKSSNEIQQSQEKKQKQKFAIKILESAKQILKRQSIQSICLQEKSQKPEEMQNQPEALFLTEEKIREKMVSELLPSKLQLSTQFNETNNSDQNFDNINHKIDQLLLSLRSDIKLEKQKISLFQQDKIAKEKDLSKQKLMKKSKTTPNLHRQF